MTLLINTHSFTHSDIHSVEPSVGSPTGGTLLTIQGAGFTGVEGEIEVDIDGIPCEVKSMNVVIPACTKVMQVLVAYTAQ